MNVKYSTISKIKRHNLEHQDQASQPRTPEIYIWKHTILTADS